MDVCVALAILAIALGTLVGSVFYAMRLEEANDETAAASQLLRSMFERMNSLPFEDVFAAYNQTKGDDPEPGRDYLGELQPDEAILVVGKKAGPVATITFPGDGIQLREDVVDEALGMPRDLDGDDDIDGADHAADYTLLPLTLRLEWEGASGTRSLTMTTVLRSP